MNTSFYVGIILLLLGTTGVWTSRIKFPNAPYFPAGTVFSLTQISYTVGLIGGFLICWGIFSKIKNFSVRTVLKVFLILATLWIGWQFYQTGIWDWHRFWQFR